MKLKQSHVVCGVMLAVAAGMVMAGTGGEEFNDVWDTLVKWTQVRSVASSPLRWC